MNLLTRPSIPVSMKNNNQNINYSFDNYNMTRNAAANEIVERSFHAFIAELFLYALPKSLLFYPRQQIIGCYVDKLLSILNGTSRAICSVLVETNTFLDLLRRHGVALELENSIIE